MVLIYGTRPKRQDEKVLTCALSVRLQEEDMMFLRTSAEKNCRTLADEVRYIIKTARHKAGSSK